MTTGQKSGSIKLAKKDAKEAKPAAAKKEKAEPKTEKKAAAAKAEPKAKKETATKTKMATTTVSTWSRLSWEKDLLMVTAEGEGSCD